MQNNASQDLHNRTILYVEDYEPAAMIMKHIAKKMDLNCVIASNGDEAIRLAGSGSFQLALVDVNLPDTEGWDLAEKLKKIVGCKTVGFTAAPENIPKDKRDKFDAIEYKAFDQEDIKQIIREHLD